MVKQSISLQQKLGFYSLISAKTFDTAILRSSIGTRRDIGQNQALTLIFLREFLHATVKT